MFSLSFLTSLCFFDANLRIIDKTVDRRGHFFPLQATKSFAERKKPLIFAVLKARMAELVDALDSKSSARKGVRVRPPLRVLLIKGLAILLRGFFVFPFSLIPPGTNLLLTFQRAIPQNPIFPAVLIPPVFSLSNGIKPFLLPCVEHRYLSLFNILPSYSFSPSKHKKTGGLKRPPAKVNSRKTVYYR